MITSGADPSALKADFCAGNLLAEQAPDTLDVALSLANRLRGFANSAPENALVRLIIVRARDRSRAIRPIGQTLSGDRVAVVAVPQVGRKESPKAL